MKKHDLFCRAGGDCRGGEQGLLKVMLLLLCLQSNLCGLPVSHLDRHCYPFPPPSWLVLSPQHYCMCGTSHVPSEERDWESFLGLQHLESYPAHSG